MPIKPKPRTYVCPSCGWKKSVFPASDVMMQGDYFKNCPKCGGKTLEQRQITIANEVLYKFLEKLNGR